MSRLKMNPAPRRLMMAGVLAVLLLGQGAMLST